MRSLCRKPGPSGQVAAAGNQDIRGHHAGAP
jgi:hypothetical protein